MLFAVAEKARMQLIRRIGMMKRLGLKPASQHDLLWSSFDVQHAESTFRENDVYLNSDDESTEDGDVTKSCTNSNKSSVDACSEHSNDSGIKTGTFKNTLHVNSIQDGESAKVYFSIGEARVKTPRESTETVSDVLTVTETNANRLGKTSVWQRDVLRDSSSTGDVGCYDKTQCLKSSTRLTPRKLPPLGRVRFQTDFQ